jgi:hypothetical protein
VTAPEPGWYADPAGVTQNFRWWDGLVWTRWLSREPTSTPPRTEAVDPPPPAAEDPVRVAVDRTVRLPAAVAITLAVLVLALITVGAVVSYSADRLRTGPEVDPPIQPASVHTAISYDARTRLTSVREMHFVAPGKPFTCLPAPNVQSGLFRSYFACDALVHENYAKSEDWHSSVGFAVLDDPLIVPGELGRTADEVATTLLAFYPRGQTTIRKRKLEDLNGIAPSGRGVLLSMEVRLSVKGLPTSYDTLIITVVELSDGEYATWFAADPDDSPKDVSKALKSSAATVTANP